jgi:hypothetical protein
LSQAPDLLMPGLGELRMRFLGCRGRQCSLTRVAVCLIIMVAIEGCGENKTLDRAADEQAKQSGYDKQSLAKLAGRVTVDGQPPAADTTLVVILNDPEHLDATANGKSPSLYSVCGAQGDFALMTKPGKYIVTFAELHQAESPRAGARAVGRGPGVNSAFSRGNLRPPDELKNLYNDPNKNAQEEKFKLDLKPPGQEDYQIDLAVAGKEAVATPGPHAVTRITRH